MAAEGEEAAVKAEMQPPVIQLPLSVTAEHPGTLLMMMQSPEQPVTLAAAKALLQFVKDGGEGDEPKQITILRGALGDGGGLPVLIKLLTQEAWCGPDPEVQAVCLLCLARCAGEAVPDGRLILRMRNGERCKADVNGEEKCRLKTVELGGLKPMVELTKSEELDVAAKAAFCLACHALDSPVRLAVKTLDGVRRLLNLMKTSDDSVVNNASLALSTVLQHVEAKDELHKLHGMEILIDQGLRSDSVEVQENSARAVSYAIEQEANLKDFRRLKGIDILIEMLAALPDTDRVPNDKVRQSTCFALATSAFDSECRTEIRMKEGLRALSNCLTSEESRVQEEALMALANCAFDVPCKQTIGALGCLKSGISLMGSSEMSVVANACVALSRLVFDFMSGEELREEGGVQQLADTLNQYVRDYHNYKAYKEKEAEGTAEGEAVELPDLRLGKTILECCKSCAEQGNVRSDMRAIENFFPNMFKMIQHEDEIVSGMACQVSSPAPQSEKNWDGSRDTVKLEIAVCTSSGDSITPLKLWMALQALSNAAFDVEGRPMLLEMNAIPEFVRCLTYKDVDTQLAAARAIGNFALDSFGRNKVRESGGMIPLVKQLQAKDENGKDAIEPRRAAIFAIGKCAADRQSAVELCDIGALKQLLSLMETHWKQLGQAAQDTVERLLEKSQSAKLWLRGVLDFDDVTSDGFYDMGTGKDYTSLKELQEAPVDTDREVLLADQNKDSRLRELIERVKEEVKTKGFNKDVQDKRDVDSIKIKRDCVKRIAEVVSETMGGSISYEKYQDFGCAAEIQRCKKLRESNVIWIGDLKKGSCRHRAFLFKYLCDIVLTYMCSIERAKIERGVHVGHAWNEVKFAGDVDQNGSQKTYVVDLMHSPGALYRSDSGLPDPGTHLIPPDEQVARYQRKDVYHFISLSQDP